MTQAVIGIGSNLGDRFAYVTRAIAALASHPRIEVAARAKIYETEPLGPSEHMFLNTAVLIETSLGPLELLDVLLEIEKSLGRERRIRWGARTLDLDLLWLSSGPFSDARLTVPHPELLHRVFALAPLCDVLADAEWAHQQLASLGGAPALYRELP